MQMVLTIAGYGLGSMVGAPWLGAAIGSMAGRAIDNKWLTDPIKVETARLKDLRVQTSAYGEPIPHIYGAMRVAGNVIWSTDIVESSSTTTQGGGCFGGPEVQTTKYSYSVSCAVGICRGPITKILKVWADSKLIYDCTDAEGAVISPIIPWVTVPVLPDFWGYSPIYHVGNETQEPNPHIEARDGAGNVPAYRGLAYAIFVDFPLAQFGNRIPNFTFEVTTAHSDIEDYDTIEGLASVWGLDQLRIDPLTGVYITRCRSGLWDKFNTITREIVTSVDHETSMTNAIPATGNSFDMDEEGRIYTTRDAGTLIQYFVELDPDTLLEVDCGDNTYSLTHKIYAVRNSHYPMLLAIKTGYAQVYIIDRTSLNVITSVYMPASVNAQMIAIDHANGEAWVLCTDDPAYTTTQVVHIDNIAAGTSTVYDVSATIIGGRYICYDSATDQVIIGSQNDGSSGSDRTLGFFDAADMSALGTLTDDRVVGASNESTWRNGVVDGYLWIHTSDTLVAVDVDKQEIAAAYDPPDGMGVIGGNCVYDPITQCLFISRTQGGPAYYAKWYLNRATASTVKLSTIVDSICNDVGLTDSEIDITDLTQDVRGFIVDQRMEARGAIQLLMEGFLFDAVESSGKLKFINRGDSSLLTIADAELAAHFAGESRPQELITTRTQDHDLPITLDLAYLDPDAHYDVGIQRAFRQEPETEHQASLSVPIVLSADEAMQLAIKHLISSWIARTTHKFFLHRKYAYLDPADIITISEGGNSHIVRLEQITYRGGVLEVSAVNEDSSAYSSDASGIALPEPDDDVEYPGPTRLVLLDLPLLSYSQNDPGTYYAVQGLFDAWEGCGVYKSDDGGATWNLWATAGRDAIIGKALDTLGDVTDPWIWDYGNSVTVQMMDEDDNLSSATELQVLNGSNLAVLGDEIIQFQTATNNSDNTWTLSNLLRGRYGTEWATGSHATSETFALLAANYLHWQTLDINEVDQARDYVAVSLGLVPNYSASQNYTWTGRNLMPWSPQHVEGSRDGSNNLTITWIRRTRYGGEWRDKVDVPLGEDSEVYEVDIIDTDSAGTVLRTITATSETASYTAAEQTADGLSPGDPVDVIVYQKSSEVGRGWGTEATV